MIQVVADCILNSGRKREPVSPDEVLQALDYFNIPETLWPEGLIAASAVSQSYDREACTIMDTVKGKVMAMARNRTDFDRTQQYYVYRNSEPGPLEFGNAFDLKTEFDVYSWSKLVLQLPQPLKERSRQLQTKRFCRSSPKTQLYYKCPSGDSASSWSSPSKCTISQQRRASIHI